MKFYCFLLAFVFTTSALMAQQEQVYARKTALWRNNEITISWDNPTPENQHGRDLVKKAIEDTWEKYSVLKFTGWGATSASSNADIHIYIEDDGPHTKGLGMELKNKPQGMVLNFTFKNWSPSCQQDVDFCIQAIAVHEFGHAIGFAHEQNRADCSFPNCFNKEQGSNGDWFVTACDLQSIMNYCNPKWNNNGFLSALDIQGVQFLYGARDEVKLFSGLQLVHSAEQVAPIQGKRISHVFNIYVVGTKDELGQIEKVEYHLHPTFKRNIMESVDRENKFGIGIRVWGQFKITADVYQKGKNKPIQLERYLDFQGTGIRPAGESDE